MQILTQSVPAWVSILFLLALPFPVILMASAIRKGAIKANFSPSKSRQVFLYVIAFWGLFFTYSSLISFTGVFKINSLPPRVLLYTALPLLLMLTLAVTQIKTFKTALQHMPLHTQVGIHLFRFIGIFFFLLDAYGAIPTRFAYVAGIGDVATAILGIFVIRAIQQKKSYARALTIGWNIFGLADIISVLVTAIIITKQSILAGTEGITDMGAFPFCLIPAFAPATIIFLHACTFIKLRQESKVKIYKLVMG